MLTEKSVLVDCNSSNKIFDAIYEDDFNAIEGCKSYHYAYLVYMKEKVNHNTIQYIRI